jgi:hypothetical protein
LAGKSVGWNVNFGCLQTDAENSPICSDFATPTRLIYKANQQITGNPLDFVKSHGSLPNLK